jgi:hypothetical protein
MQNDEMSQTFKVLEVQGSAWIHHEGKADPLSIGNFTAAAGDILITEPMSRLMIELPSGTHLHLGGPQGDALAFDKAVEDSPLSLDEVAAASSFLNETPTLYTSHVAGHELNFASLMALHDSSTHQANHNAMHLNDLEVRDIISDFNPVTDRFMLPSSASIALGSEDFVRAVKPIPLETIAIAFHKIDDHGNLSFKDVRGTDIALTEMSMLNSVVDYLTHNFNGKAGDTLMFKVAHDSYIYHFHPEAYAQQFSLTKFEGLSFEGMSHSHDGLFGNYLHVDFS